MTAPIGGQGTYRQEALDHISSPDQLDQLLRITSPAAWFALLALGALIVVALLWGVFGTLTDTQQTQAVLIRSNPILDVRAPRAGRIAVLNAEAGAVLLPDTWLATLLYTTQAGQERTAQIRGGVNGRVLGVRVQEGQPVDAGTLLLRIESYEGAARDLEAVTFVTLGQATQVSTGMGVRILPAAVTRERRGYLMGTVQRVSRVAASYDEMLQVLRDEALAGQFFSQDALFEVRISLEQDQNNAYVWSIPQGPDVAVVSGMPASAEIILSERPPLSLLLGG
jgi:multidrug efflux pump subunit AcrA (membrane-fusion protein)